jgi:Lrp/AsnC family leucine-responsive transcriptional regulator
MRTRIGHHDRRRAKLSTWPIEGVTSTLARNVRSLGTSAYESGLLDGPNLRILGELEQDARLPLAELGRRVSMSAPAVAERVQRLEQAGVIRGYHADIDPRAVGYPIAALVRIRPAVSRQLHKIPELAKETPEVVECHRVTGEDCFVLKLHLRSIEDLEEVLDRFVLLGQTTTSIIHSSPLPPRSVPLTRPG